MSKNLPSGRKKNFSNIVNKFSLSHNKSGTPLQIFSAHKNKSALKFQARFKGSHQGAHEPYKIPGIKKNPSRILTISLFITNPYSDYNTLINTIKSTRATQYIFLTTLVTNTSTSTTLHRDEKRTKRPTTVLFYFYTKIL